MEDYNWAMLTHAMDLFKECMSLKKLIPKIFFYKLVEQFINKGFGNVWQLALKKIHETPKIIICNSKQASMGATKMLKPQMSYRMIGPTPKP